MRVPYEDSHDGKARSQMATCKALFGKGQLVLDHQCQSIAIVTRVSCLWKATSIGAALEGYFASSEQLPSTVLASGQCDARGRHDDATPPRDRRKMKTIGTVL